MSFVEDRRSFEPSRRSVDLGPRWVLQCLMLPLAIFALWLLAKLFVTLPGWALPLAVFVTTAPIFVFRNESRHFVRRTLLERGTEADSRLRAVLWDGHLLSAWLALSSVVLAFLLLAAVQTFERLHWVLLAADGLALAGAGAIVAWLIKGEISGSLAGLVSRRYVLLGLNVVALTAGFAALDYWHIGAPDTRGLRLENVISDAWEAAYGEVTAPAAAMAVAAVAATEAGLWHLAQTAIPQVYDSLLRLGVWAAFLLGASILFTAVTLFLLGISATADALAGRQNPFTVGFWGAALFLGSLHLGAYAVVEGSPDEDAGSLLVDVFSELDPCGDVGHETAALKTELGEVLQGARHAAVAEGERSITAAVDTAHARAVAGTDDFLHWYFSVFGEYERIAASVGGGLAKETERQLRRRLFGDSRVLATLNRELASVDAAASAAMLTAAEDMRENARDRVANSPCLAADPPVLASAGSLDLQPFSEGALVGPAAGTATVMVARTMSKGAVKSGLVLAGKAAAKYGSKIVLTAAGAAAVCAAAGPVAVVCGGVAAIASWLAVDYAVVEIEEHVYRDEMRQEIVEELDRWRDDLKHTLIVLHIQRVDGMAQALERFIPAEDG